MTKEEKDPFVEWMNDVELSLGWTDNKWATRAGISASVLSRARQGITPKWEACVALANAARRSPIAAFRKAGLLPPGPEEDVRFSDWQYLLNQLPPDDQDELRQIALVRIERRNKERGLKSLNSDQKKVG
jgi:transcriptional regulator with XRE-family HTH domain